MHHSSNVYPGQLQESDTQDLVLAKDCTMQSGQEQGAGQGTHQEAHVLVKGSSMLRPAMSPPGTSKRKA